MIRLLQIEWLKIARYRTFYVFTGFYVLLIFLVYYGFDKIIHIGMLDLSVVYKFPDVWYYVAYVSSWFAPVLGLLMINLVSNEFTFRTLRQHIIDGLSREEILKSKLLLAAMISLGAGLVALFSGLLFGFTKGGAASGMDIFSEMGYLLRVVWVCFGLMAAAILISLLVRRSALSILIFIAIYWIIEPLVGRVWLSDLYPYFPLNSLDEFISSPISFESVQFGKRSTPLGVNIAGLIYPVVFVLASWRIMKTKDF